MTDGSPAIVRVVDTETTGLPPKPCRVVQAAFVDLVCGIDGKWSRGATWQSFVNPEGVPIDVEAMAVHHITDAMVADAPPWADVRPLIFGGRQPEDCIFAAFKAEFDKQFFDDVLGLRWACIWKNAVALWPECPSFKNQVLRYWLGLKLNDPEMAIPHQALGDAYVSAAIMRRQFNEGLTVQDMLDIEREPAVLPRFYFGEHAGKPIHDVPTSYLEWMVYKSKGGWDVDVLHTAKVVLGERRAAARGRSPIDASAVAAAQAQAEGQS